MESRLTIAEENAGSVDGGSIRTTGICIIGEIGGARRARVQRNSMNTVYQAEPKKVSKIAHYCEER